MKTKAQEPIPIALRDCSYPAAVRKIVDVLYPEGALSNEELVAHAGLAVQWGGKYGEAQAISCFFWRSRDDIGRVRAVASADFAPRGRWEDAHTAKLGDYSLHEFSVVFNDTEADGEDADDS